MILLSSRVVHPPASGVPAGHNLDESTTIKIGVNSHWQVQVQDLFQISATRLLRNRYLLTDYIDIKAIRGCLSGQCSTSCTEL